MIVGNAKGFAATAFSECKSGHGQKASTLELVEALSRFKLLLFPIDDVTELVKEWKVRKEAGRKRLTKKERKKE